LGSKQFKGYVSSVAITKDDGGAALFASTPGIRIPLDKNFSKIKLLLRKISLNFRMLQIYKIL
jgi:hypothetical protein